MRKYISRLLGCLLTGLICSSASAQKDIYEIRTYLLGSADQVKTTDSYLEKVCLPALHRSGIRHIGVFKPLANDTAQIKRIYVLIPYASLGQWQQVNASLAKDPLFRQAATGFNEADTGHRPFERIETALLEAFPTHTWLTAPGIKVDSETVYELRSYESPTIGLHNKKVAMFNEGGETGLFKRLGFNAVFYAEVLCGSRMPNLMYMVVFENSRARSEHWKTFGNDPQWKKISADPVYENAVSVSHIDSIPMHRTSYSDL
jgi:hypothetical protein